MRVLYLTPWYPSERDAMLGLFVQKHVECVRAQGVDVRVIFSNSLNSTWRQWRQLRYEGWIPDIVQLNVIQKQGLLAMWLKKRYGIPYIIVEHWSGYLSENGQYMHSSAMHRRMAEHIVHGAEAVLTVSQKLADSMQACGLTHAHYERINNVVDDFFFRSPKRETKGKKQGIKTLLYISCFDEHAKNVKGLLLAAKELSRKRQDWRLVLVGTGIDYTAIRAFADNLNISQELLVWTGELTPREVADWFHQSDAFVLSSRYETYGIVFAEAAAAGVPILSTPVGIAEEVADVIVPQEIAQQHPEQFADYIETILWDTEKRSHDIDARELFSATSVGKKLKNIYGEIIK